MTEKPFEPGTVTKPIQLLAAWLIGLVCINGSFLTGASLIHQPDWAPAALVVAAIANVPIFLFSLFLLQTKFRPEMQEDSYYNKYLERRFSEETRRVEYATINERVDLPNESMGRVKTVSEFLIADRKGRRATVLINDLLPHYDEIRNAMNELGINIGETFGSNSKGKKVPDKFVFSVGDGFPASDFQKIFQVIEPMGLEALSFADYEFNKNKAYIGSYIAEAEPGKVRALSPALRREVLSPGLTDEGLKQLLVKAL